MSKKRKKSQNRQTTPKTAESKSSITSSQRKEQEQYSAKIMDELMLELLETCETLNVSPKMATRANVFMTWGQFEPTEHECGSYHPRVPYKTVVVCQEFRKVVRDEPDGEKQRGALILLPSYAGFDRHLPYGYTFRDLAETCKKHDPLELRLPTRSYLSVDQLLGLKQRSGQVAISALPGTLFDSKTGKPLTRMGGSQTCCFLLHLQPEKPTHAIAHLEFAKGMEQRECQRVKRAVSQHKFQRLLSARTRTDGTADLFVLLKLSAKESANLLEKSAAKDYADPSRLIHSSWLSEGPQHFVKIQPPAANPKPPRRALSDMTPKLFIKQPKAKAAPTSTPVPIPAPAAAAVSPEAPEVKTGPAPTSTPVPPPVPKPLPVLALCLRFTALPALETCQKLMALPAPRVLQRLTAPLAPKALPAPPVLTAPLEQQMHPAPNWTATPAPNQAPSPASQQNPSAPLPSPTPAASHRDRYPRQNPVRTHFRLRHRLA